MKIHFDPGQPWQQDAIDAVVDVFDGQDRRETVAADGTRRNVLSLGSDRLLENLRGVQLRHDLPASSALHEIDLSVEMETGTGKTYAYLRTVYALHRHYGWDRFCIAVPSVAIREGVLQSLEATAEHFADLFPGVSAEWHVYDGSRTSSLRSFSRDVGIQILILNIDAFNKAATNLMYRSDDRLGGNRPIDLLAATQPVVVLDEPQNMESPRAKEAIASLKPLCTLRYSATHRHHYHLLYQLDPVRAHALGLVKSVEVCSVTDASNRPWIGVGDIRQRPLRAHVQITSGRPRSLTVRVGDDLGARSGRDRYDGWVVAAIDDDGVHFDNGIRIASGQAWGDEPDKVARTQVEEAVRLHLERELTVQTALGRGQMKVLTLFFIDRVARYAEPESPIRLWFEDAWIRLIREPRYRDLAPFPDLDRVHGGYFAKRRARAVDTRGRSRADEDAYSLIMRDKERLLDPAEPLRFIFSHSALREGWDNPNVFVVCTLANAHSSIRKRQEIGRGLRLPVQIDGRRCWRPDLNRLTVVANHSYKRFAEALQREHHTAWGSSAVPIRSSTASPTTGREFLSRWAEIHPTLRWDLEFDTQAFIVRAAKALRQRRGQAGAIQIAHARLDPDGAVVAWTSRCADATSSAWPDLLSILGRRTHLSRGTVAEILVRSGRLETVEDPEGLLVDAEAAIRGVGQALLGGELSIQRVMACWRLRNTDDHPHEGTRLELPGGFAVSTPLGTFRPNRAIWAPGKLHLSRPSSHTDAHD